MGAIDMNSIASSMDPAQLSSIAASVAAAGMDSNALLNGALGSLGGNNGALNTAVSSALASGSFNGSLGSLPTKIEVGVLLVTLACVHVYHMCMCAAGTSFGRPSVGSDLYHLYHPNHIYIYHLCYYYIDSLTTAHSHLCVSPLSLLSGLCGL